MNDATHQKVDTDNKFVRVALPTSDGPIILDVSGYFDGEQASAQVRETVKELFNLVEEVHEYIPEKSGLDENGENW